MTRVKRGFKRVQRRKRMMKFAKGFYGAKSRLYRSAKEAVEKALGYGYRDRKVRSAISAASGSCASAPPAR